MFRLDGGASSASPPGAGAPLRRDFTAWGRAVSISGVAGVQSSNVLCCSVRCLQLKTGLKSGTEKSRRRWRIAASFDSAREGIDRATRASRAAVAAPVL